MHVNVCKCTVAMYDCNRLVYNIMVSLPKKANQSTVAAHRHNISWHRFALWSMQQAWAFLTEHDVSLLITLLYSVWLCKNSV